MLKDSSEWKLFYVTTVICQYPPFPRCTCGWPKGGIC